MKRAIIFTLALILFTVPALASDLDSVVEGHNAYTWICGAARIESEPEISSGMITYTISKGIEDTFLGTNDQVNGFACICTDSSEESEFLAQCVTACYNFAGMQAGSYCYDVILSQFLFVRSGMESERSFKIPGIMVEVSKQDFGYLFMLVKVE